MPAVSRHEERRFWKDLCKLFNQLIEDVKNGSGLLNGVSQEVRQFMQSDQVKRYLDRVVGRMVRMQRKVSANSWREAAYKSQDGPELYKLISAEMKGPVGTRVWQLISENSAYIRTLPEQWAKFASEYAYRETLKGRRPEDVEAELRKIIPGHMVKNLKCIARTECAKANAAIVQARAEACGIKAYFWRSVKDERSRDAHRMMDGILVFYNDPPNPEAIFGGRAYGNYHAGNTFNCRCWQEPVLDMAFLPNVVRVHDHGRIITMTKYALQDKYGKIT